MDRAFAMFMALLVACGAAHAASPTSTLLKTRASYSAAVTTGKWQSNFHKAKKYATDNGIPFIAVWSNGDACGHCIMFENGCNTTYFKNWMKSSGMVFYFATPADKGNGTTAKSGSKADDGRIGGNIFNWCRKNKNTAYPLVRIYWPAGNVDVATIGDTVDGNKDGSSGGKKSVAYFKGKLGKFKPAAEVPAVVKPYTIEFAPNGATNMMDAASAVVGKSLSLPANTLVRPDFSFLGWAKTATGAVSYKNKASVKNLTTASNGVVTLYAKWTRTTYRTYFVGVKTTIPIPDCKGWERSSGTIGGMTWSQSTGKWTGTPKKAGTYTIKYKKKSSTRTRKVVVVNDAVTFEDETELKRVFAEGDKIVLSLNPASHAGAAKSVKVTGLPAGLVYSGGAVVGQTERVGTFTATVTVVSAKGQKLTRQLSIQVGVPDFCVGTFNGFVGFVDTNRIDELALSNRGTFRMSAPGSANLSAKVVTARGAYSFTGFGWLNAGGGSYLADLTTSDGKHLLRICASDESMGLTASFHEVGSFVPSYGTEYSVWAQRAPFARNADGSYCDPAIDAVMGRVVGTWHFRAYASGSSWLLDYATAKTANLTLTVAADGTAKLAGKVGPYSVSASSAVFVFGDDIDVGFVRADFPVPVSVKSGNTTVKKTLDVWLNLWFDRDHSHYSARGEGIGAASVEAFR